MDNEITFGKIDAEGTVTNERRIKQSAIKACPHIIMVAEHYREDGSCKCDDPEEQAMMIQEWGYKKSDFPAQGKANG